jgi:hypothetical protein
MKTTTDLPPLAGESKFKARTICMQEDRAELPMPSTPPPDDEWLDEFVIKFDTTGFNM